MAFTSTLRDVLLIALFVLAQFFWLLATFAYSDTDRASGRALGRENTRGDATVTASIVTATPAEPSAPRSPNVSFPDVGGTLDPAIPSSPSTPGPDLGAQIKYCIVFPLLNAAGPPIPTFDVPVCPLVPPPAPPPGAPRLTVIKVVINDDSGTATTTDFTLLVGSTTVQSGVQQTFLAGTHVVSEATTTVTVGTTTMQYVQEFDGDCDAAGNVTLALGDVKTCTIINDDPGPGGQGGDSNGGGGGPGDGGGGGGSGPTSAGGGGGGPSTTSTSSGQASSGSSSGSGQPTGQIAGAVTPESDFMGGADGEPGAPNAGKGGRALDILGLLLFSGAATLLSAYLLVSLSRGIKVSKTAKV